MSAIARRVVDSLPTSGSWFPWSGSGFRDVAVAVISEEERGMRCTKAGKPDTAGHCPRIHSILNSYGTGREQDVL